MFGEDYAYAVARIRVLETGLLNQVAIEQLLACQDEQQCLQILTEKGWGNGDPAAGADAILSREREKIWEIMDSLVADRSVFSVLSYQDLFHNLKAAVKASILQGAAPNIFFSDCSIDGEDMVKFLTDKEYDRFPEDMREAAREAYETFLHTRDGQLADIIVDRAALDAIKKAGERSKEEIVRQYAESTVAVADIRIAVRACKTGKSSDFMKKAMAECDTLDKERLIHAAVSGMDQIMGYLAETKYGDGALALAESASAFERWCDNQIMETIRPQLYNSFSLGPLVAYVLARENEIKTVRIILTREREKIWEIMDSLVADRSVFSVLSYQDLFHNLKAAVKASILQGAAPNIFFSDCSIDGEDMVKFLTDKEYDRFPEDMREAAREAYETFLHTRDGQLADIIVDRAALDAIKKAGERSKEEIVRQYAESTVAVADIRIAVRACKTGKSSDFMKKAMAECDTLDKERLIHAAVSGMDQIMGYLAETKYGDGALALAESASAFERWCDNQIMETIRPQLYNSFSLGPLVAYVLARENEIKTVRIILTGKRSGLPEEFIRERAREMYV